MGRMEEPKTCTVCDKPLTGNQTLYCSRRCRDTACYARRLGLSVAEVYPAGAGVPALSPYWLRHAHASHALDGGGTIHVVRETLGHASLASTSRYLPARPGDSSALYLPAV